MNTQAHVIVNLAFLGRAEKVCLFWPIVLGGLAPDAPMFAFYAWQKLVVKAREAEIWSEAYFRAEWQLIFDLPNSIPLALLAVLLAWRLGAPRVMAFFSSVILHCLGDLPLHHDDAHRHFLPVSDWRFESPISYWDPAHHGLLGAGLEATALLAAVAVLARRHPSKRARWLLRAAVIFHLVVWLGGWWMWG